MSVKLFITIDTEEDLWGEFKRKDNPVENVNRIPILQDLFNRYKAIPTYLVNYPVVTNTCSLQILKKINDSYQCEIGTHCHPWNTPPFEEKINRYNSMLCNLSYNLQYKKIKTIHDKITQGFGMEPKCFRAGRWGFNTNTAHCLNKLNYTIDSSVSPFSNWKKEKGADYYLAPFNIYKFDPENILIKKTDGSLLEVPPTIGFFQKNFKRSLLIRKWILETKLSKLRLIGILNKLRLNNFHWLSPELSNADEMMLLAKTFIKKKISYLNLTFHSTSLLPGKSPFVQTNADLDKFLGTIETFLKFAQNNNIEFAPLSDAQKLSI